MEDLNSSELKKGQSITKEQALNLSLELAKNGLGRVEPNPCVGAVLFNEEKNELVSWGNHEYYGGPHAEVNCLKDVKEASGLSLVVTLEPCSHFGKTPPCADLVIDKKVSKLIYIDEDPNPLVSGRGLDRIKEAGIQVEKAPEEFGLKHKLLNDKFMHSFKKKHSYVHLKWAQSSDGKLSYLNKSTQVTSAESQMDAHFLRAQSQMVVVGLETILQDDPKLNVRLKGYEKNLMVGVLDPELRLLNKLKDTNVYKVRPKDTVFLISDQKVHQPNVISLSKTPKGQLDLNELRQKTYNDYAVQSLFVEGGAYTLRSFIEQEVFNRVSIYESKKNLNEFDSVSIFKTKEEMNIFLNQNMKPVGQKNIGSDSFKDFIRK